MDKNLDYNLNDESQNVKGGEAAAQFTQQDMQLLIQNHDIIVNPKGNEHARRVGCQRNDFEIVEILGKGAHGTALRVRSVKNGQQYVMKQIDFSSKGANPLKASYKKQALREVQLLMKLQSHPHVIKYYNSFMEDECLHIIMEYAERGDLQRYIRKVRDEGKSINESMIWLMAFQICMGVGYLHTQKIVHRDLKCMNILLTKEGVVKIGDFGVAKILQNNRIEHQQKDQAASKIGRVGTPLYLSPEVIKQIPYDYKVDSWAVGCCIYHLAALEPPFQSEDLNQLAAKILTDIPKPLQNYSESLNRFVLNSLMEKDFEKRPYINNLMKNAKLNFSDDTMKQYREQILPFIKSQYTGQDVDYIYQVLIDGNQYKTTHNFYRRNSKDSPSKERGSITNEQLFQSQFNFNHESFLNDQMMRSTNSRFLQLFPQSQQKKLTSSIGGGQRAVQNLVARTKTGCNQTVGTSSIFNRPKSRQSNFENSKQKKIQVETIDGNQDSMFRKASDYDDNNQHIIIQVKDEAPYNNNNIPESAIPKLRTPIKLQKDLIKCSEQTTTRPQPPISVNIELKVQTPEQHEDSTYDDMDPPPLIIDQQNSPVKMTRLEQHQSDKINRNNTVMNAAQAYHRQVVNLGKQRHSYIQQQVSVNQFEVKVNRQQSKGEGERGDDAIKTIEQMQAQLLNNGANRALRQSFPDAQKLVPTYKVVTPQIIQIQQQQLPTFQSVQKFNLKQQVQDCYDPPQTTKPVQNQTLENITASTGTTTVKGHYHHHVTLPEANLPPQASHVQLKNRQQHHHIANNIQYIQQSRAEKAQSTGLRIKKQSQVVFSAQFQNQQQQQLTSSSQSSLLQQQDSRNEGKSIAENQRSLKHGAIIPPNSNKITINQDALFEAYHLSKLQTLSSPNNKAQVTTSAIGIRKTHSILQKQQYPIITALPSGAVNSFVGNIYHKSTSNNGGGSRNIVNSAAQSNIPNGLYSNLANQAKSNIRIGTAVASSPMQNHSSSNTNYAKYVMMHLGQNYSGSERPTDITPHITRTHNQMVSQSSKRPTVRDLGRITTGNFYNPALQQQ